MLEHPGSGGEVWNASTVVGAHFSTKGELFKMTQYVALLGSINVGGNRLEDGRA